MFGSKWKSDEEASTSGTYGTEREEWAWTVGGGGRLSRERSASTAGVPDASISTRTHSGNGPTNSAVHAHPPNGFMKRAISLQFGKPKESRKLDPATIVMIKQRYKDVSKYVIWPDCQIPEEYNRGFLSLNSDSSKRTAVRYKHAGNHQAAVLRLNGTRWDGEMRRRLMDGELDVSALRSPTGYVLGESTFYHDSSSSARRFGLGVVPEERTGTDVPKEGTDSAVVDPKRFANIDDERTPMPKPVINSVRRSESSDDDEPLLELTSPRSERGASPRTGDADRQSPTVVIKF